jgi:glycine cleavage system P protein (glycine dehydrogenase)
MLFDHEPFESRHIGPDPAERDAMLQAIGAGSLDALMDQAIPPQIRLDQPLNLPPGMSEHQYLGDLRRLAARNRVFKSFLGLGYYDCVTPGVIVRNVLENPGWYTPYTPYQPEIAQGRLEGLLTFQTMVSDLTALPIANASLLDEATAAAEAMSMLYRVQGRRLARASGRPRCFVADSCFPQTIDVLQRRLCRHPMKPDAFTIVVSSSPTPARAVSSSRSEPISSAWPC